MNLLDQEFNFHIPSLGGTDRGGRFSDKANFVKLVKELYDEFKAPARNWLLTAAISPAK